MNLAAIEVRAREAIANLRHADRLAPANVDRWLKVMLAREPSRVLWHIRRADGSNASSIAAYIAHLDGGRTPFTCARELDMQRQLMKTPDEASFDMLRGTYLEGIARRVIHRRFNYVTDVAAMEATQNQLGTRAAPGLRGNPDDLVLTPTKRRVLLDYKMPVKRKEETDEIIPDYIPQLHTYVLLAAAADVRVAQMGIANVTISEDLAFDLTRRSERLAKQVELASFDGSATAQEAAQRAFDMFQDQTADFLLALMDRDGDDCQTVKPTLQAVAWDRTVAEKIIVAANDADRRAMAGELAPWPTRQQLQLDDERVAKIAPVAEQFVLVKAAFDFIEAIKDDLNGQIKSALRGVPLKKVDMPFHGIAAHSIERFDAIAAIKYLESVGVVLDDALRPQYDTARLIEDLLKQGTPLNDYQKGWVLDDQAPAKLSKKLEELGVDVDQYRTHSPVVSLSRKNSGPHALAVADAKTKSQMLVRSLLAEPAASTPSTQAAQVEDLDLGPSEPAAGTVGPRLG